MPPNAAPAAYAAAAAAGAPAGGGAADALLLVSSYTDYGTLAHTPRGVPEAASGVAAYEVDATMRALVLVSRSAVTNARLHNAAFLVKHPSMDVVYASTERIDTEGSIFAMRLDRNRRELTVLNSAPAKGRSTCFLNCDAGRSVLTAVNYWDARLAVVGINPLTGHLAGGPAKQVLQQARGEYVDRCAPGREEHWAYRQRWAHTHCAVTEPYTGSNNNLFVADLGEDKILWFDVSGALVRRGECQLPRGVGPRHLVFHPTLRVAYVVNELNSSVSMLAVDEAALNPETRRGLIQGEGGGPIAEVDDSDDGGSNRSSVTGAEAGSDALTLLQSISTLPADWQGRSAIKNGVWKAASHCSEIKVHPSGKFLFVANRGHDSLAVFAIDQATGTLAAPTFKPSGGMTPRNFNFACGGDFVVVGNQDSNTLALFSFDATSGALTLEDCIDHPSPNYVYTVPRSEAARAA